MDDDWSGKTLGKYLLTKSIGCGAMGVVYKAQHIELRREAAVKLLLPANFSRKRKMSTLIRFQQEATVVSRIHHRNIVKIYDIGQQDDVHYIAMELVNGKSLEYFLDKQGALPLRKSIRIIQNAAEGLAAAHEMNILHRDIKPANILLSRTEEVKLADFGTARFDDSSSKLTETGAIVGTLAYTSPEQLKGQATTASDLYSLGVTFFEILAGRLPYDGKTPFAIMSQHLNAVVPSIREIRAEVPEKIDAIIRKLLAKDSRKRFSSASELAEILLPYVAVKKTTAMLRQVPRAKTTKIFNRAKSEEEPRLTEDPEIEESVPEQSPNRETNSSPTSTSRIAEKDLRVSRIQETTRREVRRRNKTTRLIRKPSGLHLETKEQEPPKRGQTTVTIQALVETDQSSTSGAPENIRVPVHLRQDLEQMGTFEITIPRSSGPSTFWIAIITFFLVSIASLSLFLAILVGYYYHYAHAG